VKKIVIIEDDHEFGASIRAQLAKLGYDVEHVNRPCAVANTLRTFQPDIVLTDQLLPGTHGRNIPYTLRQLNSEQPPFKLLLFSASCKEANAEMVDKGLVDGCLDRAMPIDELGDALESF